MLLHESTGLQIQQTSATSGNAGIRVQGLDGRYTQLLKDGYPNFGNFASGLSILEIPPLDLKQVEVIKGPASTLYGGGAIAGVVNFISKSPSEKGEYDLLLNRSNIGQTNIGGYASKKKGKFGYSLLALVNFQKEYDVDNDDFSEIPNSENFTIHPRLFYYPSASTRFMIGNSYSNGTNRGGDMQAIDGKMDNFHNYIEKNRSTRNTTTFEFEKKYADKNNLTFKQSISYFDRSIQIPGFEFSGSSMNYYTDVSRLVTKKKHTLIGGLNLVIEKFDQRNTDIHSMRSATAGVYLQDTWDISDRVIIETGARFDHVTFKNVIYKKNNGFFLPKVSALFKITNKISSRIGGGLGYKIPSLFTEQAESMQYRNILPLNQVIAERSIGGTADINFKTKLNKDFDFSYNQLFFYTRIQHPFFMQPDAAGNYFFQNASQPVTSFGIESNLKLIFRKDVKLFMGYTLTNANAKYATGNQSLLLMPRHKLNLALMYEKEDNFKFGLEGYFTDRQYIFNYDQSPAFWELGFMAQKTFNKISIYINFENFTDERQSNYKTVSNPPHSNPTFDPIWNHTEGFVLNGGIKIKF
jgi:iron complex outermembrane receptor protein/outer membrane receptor for ferrienterochelin and colicins